MKTLFLTLICILSFGLNSIAKVQDFNSLIREDSKAQKELHSKLKNQVYTQKEIDARNNIVRSQKDKDRQAVVFYDDVDSQVAAPSKNKYFRYDKELKQKSANPKKNQHRVAKELRELGL